MCWTCPNIACHKRLMRKIFHRQVKPRMYSKIRKMLWYCFDWLLACQRLYLLKESMRIDWKMRPIKVPEGFVDIKFSVIDSLTRKVWGKSEEKPRNIKFYPVNDQFHRYPLIFNMYICWLRCKKNCHYVLSFCMVELFWVFRGLCAYWCGHCGSWVCLWGWHRISV